MTLLQRCQRPRAVSQEANLLKFDVQPLRVDAEAGGPITPSGELVLEPPPRPPDTGLMRIMSQNGDDRIVWSRRVADEVREAYDRFKELIDKGYRAYAILADGSRGHELFAFNPTIEESLLVPTGELVPG